MKPRIAIALLSLTVVVAILLRLLYLVQFSALPLFDHPNGPDVFDYDQWAKAILAGQYQWTSLHIHAPLYPFFLALLYKVFALQFFWLRLAQALLGFSAFFLLFLVLRNISDRRPAWIVLVLAAVYPPLIFYQSDLVSEALLLPLVCAFLAVLYWADSALADARTFRRGLLLFILAGLLAGAAALTHPLVLAFLVGELLLLAAFYGCRKAWSWPRRLLPALLVATTAAAVLLPVLWYNARLPGGRPVIQANGGMNIFIGNNPAATGIGNVRPGHDWDELCERGERAESVLGISPDHYFLGEVADFIRNSPGSWLRLLGDKFLYVFNRQEITAGADLQPLRFSGSFMRWTAWSSGVLMTLALFGLLVNFRRRDFWWHYRHFLVLLFCYWLALTFTLVSGRHRAVMLPAVFVLASLGVLELLRLVRERSSWRVLIGSGLALLLASLIVWLPTPPPLPGGEVVESQVMLAQAYVQQNRLAEAEQACAVALAADSKAAMAHCLRGMIAMKQGRLDRARDGFVTAIKLDLPTSEAWVNLALMASATGNLALAEQCFAEARKRWPHAPFMLYNYGYFLVTVKRFDEAEKVLLECLDYDPACSEAINALGVLYLQQQRNAAAISCFERLLRLVPDNPGYWLNAGAAYLQDKRIAQAEICADRLAALGRDLPQTKVLRDAIAAARTR